MGNVLSSGLWTGVEEAGPENPQPLLVCADWCDENGNPALAYALRWSAAHKRRPYRRTDVVRHPWQWIRDQKRYFGNLSLRKVEGRKHAVLAPLVFAAGNLDRSDLCLETQYASYVWLGFALERLRKVVEMRDIVIPPQPAIVRLGPVTCSQCGIVRERERTACPVCGSGEVKP